MFRPAALFIGLRYTRAKRRNHFISFISFVSIFGITLGVAALITVLSVMNGFDKEIKNRIFSMVPPITVSSFNGKVGNWQHLQNDLSQLPVVIGSAPFVSGEVLLNNEGTTQPAQIFGILPQEQSNVSEVAKKMVQGQLNDLQSNQFGIVLGEDLATRLDVKMGDKIMMITPQVSLTPAGIIPRYKRFTVVGLFKAGGGFGFDKGLGFIHLNDAQKLLEMQNDINGLFVNINNVFAAPRVAQDLMTQFPETSISTWVDQFGEFFHAVKLEKTMMFFILLLILAVAAFNTLSTLVMVVNEKISDIAILRTFGATPKTIMTIFIIQGSVIGIFGTLFGVILGVLLAWNATAIVNMIEAIFHVQFLSSNVYFVNYLPSQIQISDILKISGASLLMSLLATIYPAWRAAKTDPVESLRYE